MMTAALIALVLAAAPPAEQAGATAASTQPAAAAPAPAAAAQPAAALPATLPAAPTSAPATAPSSRPDDGSPEGWGDIEFEVFQIDDPPEESECQATPPPLRSPCPAHRTARVLTWGGIGVAAVSLLGTITFGSIALYERAQAERLLAESPAFADVGDQVVIRQPSHPEVETYQAHRATASVMGQLAWIALGVSGAGAAAASAALLVDHEARPCTVRAQPAAVDPP